MVVEMMGNDPLHPIQTGVPNLYYRAFTGGKRKEGPAMVLNNRLRRERCGCEWRTLSGALVRSCPRHAAGRALGDAWLEVTAWLLWELPGLPSGGRVLAASVSIVAGAALFQWGLPMLLAGLKLLAWIMNGEQP